MFSVKDLIEKVDKKSCDCLFNVFDIFYFNKMIKFFNVEDIIDLVDLIVYLNNEIL